MARRYYVYIITNRYHTVFYIGVTNNLLRRIYQHKQKVIEGFSQKYNVGKLVYFEEYETSYDALNREKQLKDYRREKKMGLVHQMNPK